VGSGGRRCYRTPVPRGISSAGRAPPLQGGGHRFDPGILHGSVSARSLFLSDISGGRQLIGIRCPGDRRRHPIGHDVVTVVPRCGRSPRLRTRARPDPVAAPGQAEEDVGAPLRLGDFAEPDGVRLKGRKPDRATLFSKMGSTPRIAIVADVHERASGLPDALTRLGALVELAPLPAGDYAVGAKTIVERKSVLDLHGAILRGRFWPQLGKLRAEMRVPLPARGRSRAGSRPFAPERDPRGVPHRD
jgi:ERCC4 domain